MVYPAGNLVRAAKAALCALLVFIALAGQALAEADQPLKGVALVIGQSAYKSLTPLPNPANDAREIETLLARLGFATDLATDAAGKKLRRTLDGFIEDAEGADVALVYYSGHGIEAGGTNYLIPIDASLASLDAADENLVSLQETLERLRARARITILLLDACRTNPFPGNALVKRNAASAGVPISASGLGAPRGAVVIENAAAADSLGEVIGFAAEPGRVALDGAAGANSPYATALLKHLAANQGYDFGQVMTMVTEEVYLATGARQRPWTNASLRRLLSFGGTAADASPDEALLTGERRKLLLSIATTPSDLRAMVERLARDRSLPLDPLYGMLKRLDVDLSAGPEKLEEQLLKGAENLEKYLSERRVPARKDPEVIRLAELADRAQSEGAIALAEDYRAHAAARARELSLERETEETADRIAIASTFADYAETAILNFNHQTAAQQYALAYRELEGRDKRLAFKYRLGEANALFSHGDYKGDKAALRQAIELYTAILDSLARDQDPNGWATIQSALGRALLTLGGLETGNDNLAKAIAAYETALGALPRERAPLQWAHAQDGLGLALRTLALRESGTANLVRAAAAHEAALTELIRERTPIDWAMVQNNLGGTLQILGSRTSNLLTLGKAVTAYKAALDELAPERAPLQWAGLQFNLGNALAIMGGSHSLSEAIKAYEAALGNWPRDRVPLQWARAQGGLGSALQRLGQGETGTTNLLRAVAALETALGELTRERYPLDWATTQGNLGLAFTFLGERESGTEHLVKAVAAFDAALGEATRERVPLDWAYTQDNRGSALLLLGQRKRDRETLLRGKDAVAAAWSAYDTERKLQYFAYFSGRLKKFDEALQSLTP